MFRRFPSKEGVRMFFMGDGELLFTVADTGLERKSGRLQIRRRHREYLFQVDR